MIVKGKKTPLPPILDPIGTLLQSLLPPLCPPNNEEGEGILSARMRNRELVMEIQRIMEMQSFVLFSCAGKIVSPEPRAPRAVSRSRFTL